MLRIILFCDVERPLSNPLARALNRWVGQPFARAAATQNLPGEKVGVLNNMFQYAYQFRLVAKRLKSWNRSVYYALKWLLLGSLAYALFLRNL